MAVSHSIGAPAPANPFTFHILYTRTDGTTHLGPELSGDAEYRDRILREVKKDPVIASASIVDDARLAELIRKVA